MTTKLKPWQRPLHTVSTNGTLTKAQHTEQEKRANHPVSWAPKHKHGWGRNTEGGLIQPKATDGARLDWRADA